MNVLTRATVECRIRDMGFVQMGVVLPEPPQERVQCVLVLLYPIGEFFEWKQTEAAVSAYYFVEQKAYHAAKALEAWLFEQGVYVDTSLRLRAKDCAFYAGFGVYGRNTLLCTPEYGTAVVLQLLPVDLPFAPDPIPELEKAHAAREHCGTCMRCVEACPTQALDGEGHLDFSRCLRAHMGGAEIPEPYRELMGNRLLGCDICQRACPYNAPVPINAPREEQRAPFALDRLLDADDERRAETMREIGTLIGTNVARKMRLLAQTAIVAGNSGDLAYAKALEALRPLENSVAQVHIDWAVARLRGEIFEN